MATLNDALDNFERRRKVVMLIEALNSLIGDEFEFSVRLKRTHTNPRRSNADFREIFSRSNIKVETSVFPVDENGAFPRIEK